MTINLQESLSWFLRTVDLQIEDLRLEQAGYETVTYFDVPDVRRTILGMYALLMPDGTFKRGLFEDDVVLVDCLAGTGWLGTIRMLAPHQSELLTLLNLDFGISSVSDPQPFAHRFWELTGLAGSARSLGGLHGEELLRLYANSAPGLFKAVQCMRGGTWQRRLSVLRRDEHLRFDPESGLFDELAASLVFREVHRAFQKLRPARHASNFADGMAVASLVKRIRELESGERKPVPRFFASTKTFHIALARSGVSGELTCRLDGRLISVVRTADYFIAKAAFSPSKKGVNDSRPGYDNIEALHELRDQIASLVASNHPISEAAIAKIAFSGTPLPQIIEDLRTFSFLREVWLPFTGSTEISRTAEELTEAARLAASDDFKNEISLVIDRARKALEDNIQEYRRVASLLGSLQRHADSVRSRIKTTAPNLDLYRDCGLLRFALPDTAITKINAVLSALFEGGPEHVEDACVLVLNSIETGRRKPAEAIDELAVFGAVLWVLKMHRLLVETFHSINPLPHFSLKLIHAAAIIERSHFVDEAEQVVCELEQALIKGDRTVSDVDLAVGVAYLYFHLSMAKGFRVTWRDSDTAPNAGVCIDYMQKAILYARIAYDQLPVGDKRVYALNQLLYYLVEGDDSEAKSEMDEAARRLIGFKGRPSFWQARYDDTLARYFHRQATSETTAEKWRALMTTALNYAEEASSRGHGDEEIESYLGLLKIELARGSSWERTRRN